MTLAIADTAPAAAAASFRRWRWLPAPDTWKYHALLGAVGILILGPLGGVTASYMNFSLGFFVGGQVLAGILGSVVTYGYGAEGKHGANYIQTTAASVASLSAMAVVVQALVWLGLPQPPVWQLVLFLACIGMFGAGVGMLYTPILVDRLQLTYPSGLAVANILRALTDPVLLRRSVGTLGTGMLAGIAGGIGSAKSALLGAIDLSTSTFGAGMVVGARVGVPTILLGLLGYTLRPWFVSIGWLHEGDPFRKITFLIVLGAIMGAAIIDVTIILWQALRRLRATSGTAPERVPENRRTLPIRTLLAWIACWGAGIVATGSMVLGVPAVYMLFAIAMAVVFALVNGISVGISDSNPISSAFVVGVLLLAGLGLRDPALGMMAASVLLVSTSVACDMQQDRSTGWRLGTNRMMQFRYQVAGVLVGALLAVGFARLFMAAYPVLTLDQTVLSAAQQPQGWASSMTYKFVGALRSIADDRPYLRTAIWIGIAIGFALQLARKLIFARPAYRRFVESGRTGFAVDFVLDAVVLPSPYAASLGGFVNLGTSAWFAAGGVITSLVNTFSRRPKDEARAPDALPDDMSATSLLGGGLIAGDALAALGLGVTGLLSQLFGG